MKEYFSVDLTIECDPDRIEEIIEALCYRADDFDALITQYRYFVPKDVQES